MLLPKPFLLLAGISGTGKTRFVRDQAKRSRGDKPDASDNYKLVAVRPDWHEPSDLLGYVSRISGEPKYIATEFLKFLIQAWQEVYENKGTLHIVKEGTRPFWLCLDEMNLAPVEQYFADYLSILESREWKDEIYTCLPLISKSELVLLKESFDQENLSEADRDLYLQKIFENDELWSAFNEHGGIPIPPNLIVAGTVNMDETTHGFSRKVIDRALTLDFQEFFPNNFDEIFDPKTKPKTLSFSCETHIKNSGQLKDVKADSDGKKSIEFLQGINSILQDTSFQLAFRALNELLLSVKCFSPENGENLVAVWDDFLMQKVLPRIEGDADKLKFSGEDESGLLIDLKNLVEKKFIEICPKEDSWQRPDLLRENLNEGKTLDCDFKSLKKLDWMHNRLKQNQYTSFWA